MIVARVGCVQLLDAELRSRLSLTDGDAAQIQVHRSIVLQPLNERSRVSCDLTVQCGRLALEVSDVVDWLQELQEVTLSSWKHIGRS